ncbi:MAG: hypothetical protein IKV21_05255 [Clostridia bacterium]|nr:hypothetical protein [Clostridia bacterium]
MKKDIISQAKSVLLPYTPLKADCGLVCGKACCKGDADTGMLLFPGEDTPFPVKEKDGVRLCVCQGSCERNSRPLSCIIFPFFPYITKEGKITAKADIRGINICPLISHKDDVLFSKIFLRRVARAGRILAKDEECRRFLWETSREIDKLELFSL